MNKILGAGAAALMTVTVLAGCGGGDGGGSGGGYCDDLKSTKATVTSLGDKDLTQNTFDTLTDSVHTIADEAPSDIQGDWNTVADALDAFTAALDDAGLNLDDLQKVGQPGVPTPDPAAIAALTTASQKLGSDALTAATDSINTEVKSECGFDLNIGN